MFEGRPSTITCTNCSASRAVKPAFDLYSLSTRNSMLSTAINTVTWLIPRSRSRDPVIIAASVSSLVLCG
jgi:hypothetical protein